MRPGDNAVGVCTCADCLRPIDRGENVTCDDCMTQAREIAYANGRADAKGDGDE